MRWLCLLMFLGTLAVNTVEATPSGPVGGGSVVNARPNMHVGRDGEEDGPLSFEDVQEYVEREFGRNPSVRDVMRDPRVREYLRDKSVEERYIFQDWVTASHEFYNPEEGMERLEDTATKDFYCHDYAWREGAERTKPAETHFDPNPVLRDPEAHGFEEVTDLSQVNAGYIVVYLNDAPDNASHSAVVNRVNPNGVRDGNDITLLSKDVNNSIFRHRLGTEGSKNFFRDNYGGRGIRIFRRVR